MLTGGKSPTFLGICHGQQWVTINDVLLDSLVYHLKVETNSCKAQGARKKNPATLIGFNRKWLCHLHRFGINASKPLDGKQPQMRQPAARQPGQSPKYVVCQNFFFFYEQFENGKTYGNEW